MDEVASHRPPSEERGELGEVEEPVGIPARPVGIVAIEDPVDDVVGLRRLVEERADGGGGIPGVARQFEPGVVGHRREQRERAALALQDGAPERVRVGGEDVVGLGRRRRSRPAPRAPPRAGPGPSPSSRRRRGPGAAPSSSAVAARGQVGDVADDRLGVVERLVELDEDDDRLGLHRAADVDDLVGVGEVAEVGHRLGDPQLGGPREHEPDRALLVVVGHQHDRPPEVRVDERRRGDRAAGRRATPRPQHRTQPACERADAGQRDADRRRAGARVSRSPRNDVGEQHRRRPGRASRAPRRARAARGRSRARRARSRATSQRPTAATGSEPAARRIRSGSRTPSASSEQQASEPTRAPSERRERAALAAPEPEEVGEEAERDRRSERRARPPGRGPGPRERRSSARGEHGARERERRAGERERRRAARPSRARSRTGRARRRRRAARRCSSSRARAPCRRRRAPSRRRSRRAGRAGTSAGRGAPPRDRERDEQRHEAGRLGDHGHGQRRQPPRERARPRSRRCPSVEPSARSASASRTAAARVHAELRSSSGRRRGRYHWRRWSRSAIGVLALQGNFREHAAMLRAPRRRGRRGAQAGAARGPRRARASPAASRRRSCA